MHKNSSNEELQPYLNKKTVLVCKKDQDFILEGTPVVGLYFVYQGKAKIAKTGLMGKEQIIRFAKPGEIVGHRGFGYSQEYQISAKALERTVLCSFSTEVITKALLTVPSLTYDLLTFYSEELNRSETKVKKFAQMTVREKVIDALLYINRKFGQSKGLLNLQLTRKEIADFAGTTEEQVIRVLSSLKKEKLLNTEGKKIGIERVELLSKEIADHNYFIDS
ncbi:Crp/Fnr family transcriptional regulator [Marinoscillum sp. MHG1-6]|uniref:Crp/Fnr family transcriptional regulator n=1 Tax=Marinoscillum sp. MHG1-6 TaxID=2959627 RepID=UPI0021583428|nr:Crp/Fnr family transcriptional regulator [Marinoscillum sp. MHG1-6]